MENRDDSERINETVATKLGWTPCKQGWHDPKTDLDADLPDYCHSIEAAWEIVKKYEVVKKHDREYIFTIMGYYAGWFDEATDTWIVYEKGDTAPMAICNAFLKLSSQPLDTDSNPH